MLAKLPAQLFRIEISAVRLRQKRRFEFPLHLQHRIVTNDALLQLGTGERQQQIENRNGKLRELRTVNLPEPYRVRAVDGVHEDLHVRHAPQPVVLHDGVGEVEHHAESPDLQLLPLEQRLDQQRHQPALRQRPKLVHIQQPHPEQYHHAPVRILAELREHPILQQLTHRRLIAVQVLEPRRERFTHRQVPLQCLTGRRHGILAEAQKAQQKRCVRATLADVRVLRDPLAHLR
uniref:Uncharacterized protein n=1 Tax=Anopheles dirus TaxID=7168 RepID=A0A182NWQ1_9DIPT